MPQKATGSPFRRNGKIVGIRVSMPDGSRPLRPIPEDILPIVETLSEAELKELAQAVSDDWRQRACVEAGTPTTANEWFKTYYDFAETGEVGRKNRGNPQVTVADRRARYENHLSRWIGPRPMATMGADDLRPVVRYLNEQVRLRKAFYALPEDKRDAHRGRKPGLSPKSAANIWGELVSGFRESCSSNHDSLRVRSDDPTRLVQPPQGDDDREQAALYPSELLALLSCADVPVTRRITYAIAAYAGLRAGELRGLTASDVDLEHDMLYVRRQHREDGKKAKTKTRRGRRSVPIEPTLRALLEILVAKAKEAESMATPLVHLPPAEDCAEIVRRDLLVADCRREELHIDDEERRHFTFHGLRHTAATHWAIAGRDYFWLTAALGHTDRETTQGYIDSAHVLRSSFGQPHPALPARLIELARDLAHGTKVRAKARRSFANLATPTGIEPVLPT